MTRRTYATPATRAELLDLARWPVIVGLVAVAIILALSYLAS
jgi:hypothetical protein